MEILDGFKLLSIERAVEALRAGDTVAFPTETVYGLGADAMNAMAVAKIFEIKKRPHFDPLIIHIGEKDWIFRYAEAVPPKAALLIERFWPGPLTIILRKNSLVPDIVTAGLSTVGIRMPSHPVALNLIRLLGRPVAAPSANPFGYMSPTKASHVAEMFNDSPLIVLDGGNSSFGIESSIVSVTDSITRLHRHGAISLEDLSSVIMPLYEKVEDGSCESPGELPFHYAPHTPLKIISSSEEITNPRSSYLSFMKPSGQPMSRHVRTLSENGDLREAAAHFFSFLIELDRKDVDIIYADAVPETGLGRAIMERLYKASKRHLHIIH
ncbi:MAG: threonylcarbamoyl-AMP synthase [Syntrophobacterales bacterium]|nr:threonylcarbamoyl-AMP synthase [Syntrophobacterales bacterium]